MLLLITPKHARTFLERGFQKNYISGTQYEDMKGSTLPFDAKFPPTSENKAYEFANENRSTSPSLDLSSQSSQQSSSKDLKKNSYEVIDLKHSRAAGRNGYETIDLVFDSSSSRPSSQGSSVPYDEDDVETATPYNFATEMPAMGVPAPYKSKSVKENAVYAQPSKGCVKKEKSQSVKINSQKTESENVIENQENPYQTPKSVFSKHDDLFHPTKSAEVETNVYAAPRKANPSS